MGKRKYKDTQEAYKAKLANIQRYNAENYTRIRADLPHEYAEKLEYIAQRMNTSKAQVLKMCIDRLYSEMQEESEYE